MRTNFHPTLPQPSRTALQISLALYSSERRTERVPVIREFSPFETVTIVPCPVELKNVIPLVAGLMWETL